MTKIHETEAGTMSFEAQTDKIKLEQQILALEDALERDRKLGDSTSLKFHEPTLREARVAYMRLYGNERRGNGE